MKRTKKTSLQYVGFWPRLLAAVVDFIILSTALRLLRFSFRQPFSSTLSLVLNLGYAPFMLYQYQATLGKMLLGLKVVSQDRKKLQIFQVLLREWIGKFLSFLAFGLGFLWIAFDAKKQSWHDKLAQTLVVKA